MGQIDLSVVGKKSKPFTFSYTWKDVVLYALSIGAQADELDFVYEKAPGGLKIFPSFAVIPALQPVFDYSAPFDASRLLHGEQFIRVPRPWPPQGRVVTEGEVTNIFDKGKAAVIHYRVQGHTEEGQHLFDGHSTLFYVGGGGFGGERGPGNETIAPPENTPPDFSISYQVPLNQAALYRLNGDLNPLHLDPEFAKRGGFDTPILHGLCTYGYAVRAIVHGPCAGDVAQFKEFGARFSDVVYPGETITTEGWKETGNSFIILARTPRAVVLSNARAVVQPG